MTVALVNLESHAVLPPHSHINEQAGYILEGEFEFTIGGRTKVRRAGGVYIVPGNTEHSIIICELPTRI